MKRTYADYYEDPVYYSPVTTKVEQDVQYFPVKSKNDVEHGVYQCDNVDGRCEEVFDDEYMFVFGKISCHSLTLIISLITTVGSFLYLIFNVFLFADRHERFGGYDFLQTVNFGVGLLLLIGNRMECWFLYFPYMLYQGIVQVILMLVTFVVLIKSFLMAKTGDDDRFAEETAQDFWDNMKLVILMILYGILNAYCLKVVMKDMKYLKKKTSGLTALW
ncbi:unnamed protein product [Bursaphelenchus okinawaensis]|uniref:Uncharacterized protein n=1 Tax=Bursaphelenchus okinawaensis TaxID=465554 RepID=A0A811LMR6_9BILA|nr:unnamed protein product [Bursaphelenchus okinawaensis]CAG9124237.1 unnamed protein product [Bursaphelenchus okinawaensis]